MIDQTKPPLNELAHFGVKGMKWGVRKNYREYAGRVEARSLGRDQTVVFAKNGDRLTIDRDPMGKLALVTGRMVGRKPEDFISQMHINNKRGQKVGEFQIWREGKSAIRGEWLFIKDTEQGKGYSKAALYGMMEVAARDPKLREVRLQVPSDAGPAKHIYTNLGFKKKFDYDDELEEWAYTVQNRDR